MSDELEPSEITSLDSELLKIQGLVRKVRKDAKGHHGAYASLGAVLDTVMDHLDAADILMFQTPEGFEDGNLVVVTKMTHVPTGEHKALRTAIPIAKPDPQGYGSALSYARRYVLMAFFNLVPSDDDDGHAASTQAVERQARKEQAKVDREKSSVVRDLLALAKQLGSFREMMKLLGTVGVTADVSSIKDAKDVRPWLMARDLEELREWRDAVRVAQAEGVSSESQIGGDYYEQKDFKRREEQPFPSDEERRAWLIEDLLELGCSNDDARGMTEKQMLAAREKIREVGYEEWALSGGES